MACLLLLVALTVAGCGHPAREDKIAARDDASFEQWIAQHRDVLTPVDVSELNDARQQIRYRVMQAHPGLMSDVFADEVYSDINGRTLHELVLTSYALQIERMRVEIANYQPLIERYQGYKANPNLSAVMRKDVEANLEKLARLTRERQEELDRLKQRLDEVKQAGPVPKK